MFQESVVGAWCVPDLCSVVEQCYAVGGLLAKAAVPLLFAM
jgi:hypothetical protein